MEDPDGRNWVQDFWGLTSSPHPRLKWSLYDEDFFSHWTTEKWWESVYLKVLGLKKGQNGNEKLQAELHSAEQKVELSV